MVAIVIIKEINVTINETHTHTHIYMYNIKSYFSLKEWDKNTQKRRFLVVFISAYQT